MGEAKRRRLAGEASGPRLEPGSVRMADPGDVPDMPGHVRVTLLDDDDHGTTGHLPAERLPELLEAVGRLRHHGRRPPDYAADPGGWARLRTAALDAARKPGEAADSAVALALWLVLHGPQGPEMRRRLSIILGRAGRAAVLLRRDRTSGTVVTLVTETLDAKALAAAARSARHRLPGGAVVVSVPDDEPRREH